MFIHTGTDEDGQWHDIEFDVGLDAPDDEALTLVLRSRWGNFKVTVRADPTIGTAPTRL